MVGANSQEKCDHYRTAVFDRSILSRPHDIDLLRDLQWLQFHVVDQPRFAKKHRLPAAGHDIHRLNSLSIHQGKVVDAPQGSALGEVLAGDFGQLF